MFDASRPIHEWLVRSVAPAQGQRLLEIGAGPGDTGFLAAPRLGAGRLVSTDLAPAMVEAARKRGAELGIQNVDYRVLDAQAMHLDDASFDGAICRWGYMLMPGPAAAFCETRRVLKSGGRLAFAVFAGPSENPWVSIAVGVLREAGHLLPPPRADAWQPGLLGLGDRARLQGLLDSAGFASTTIEAVDMAWSFADLSVYYRFLVDVTALGPLSRVLPDAARAVAFESIAKRVASFQVPGGLALPAKCWCSPWSVSGTRSARLEPPLIRAAPASGDGRRCPSVALTARR